VRPLARSTLLRHWDDDAEEAALRQDIKLPYSWSTSASALAASELGGDTLIGAIIVTAVNGDVADVLRLAWGGEDEKRLARQLATCTVEQLAAIRAEAGPLTSKNTLRRLRKLALDLDCDESANVGSLLLQTALSGEIMATLRQSTHRHLAAVAGRAREEERARQNALKPFAVMVAAMDVAWTGPRPATGNIGVLHGARWPTNSIHEFIEQFVVAHADLPTGIHTVLDHRAHHTALG
jgi:hypothetical protein